MSSPTLTRGDILDRVGIMLGDTSTKTRSWIETSFNHMLFALYDIHDWTWRHKIDSFSTVNTQETYDLSTVSDGPAVDLRSAEDIELIYDTVNGTFLRKVDLRDIKKFYPQENQINKPIAWAPWGGTTVYIHPIPDGAYLMKFPYLAKAIVSTQDSDDLSIDLGIPDHTQYLFEKMVLAEAMLYFDDARRVPMLEEIKTVWLPAAVQADMKHLEGSARFKFWEEEIRPRGMSYNDFLRLTWAGAFGVGGMF